MVESGASSVPEGTGLHTGTAVRRESHQGHERKTENRIRGSNPSRYASDDKTTGSFKEKAGTLFRNQGKIYPAEV